MASQAWKTFLENHLKEVIVLDFFTVPTATFKVAIYGWRFTGRRGRSK
jgi:hypothetical protein